MPKDVPLKPCGLQLGKGSLIGNVLFQRYYEDTRWIDNPLDDAEREKLEEYVGLFKKSTSRATSTRA